MWGVPESAGGFRGDPCAMASRAPCFRFFAGFAEWRAIAAGDPPASAARGSALFRRGDGGNRDESEAAGKFLFQVQRGECVGVAGGASDISGALQSCMDDGER